MDPNQQNPTPAPNPAPTPTQPEYTQAPQQPVAPAPVAQSKKRSKRTTIALFCLLGPTTLLIGGFVLFATLNLIFNAVMPPAPLADGQLFGGPDPVWRTVLNVLSFLVTAIGFLAWLPGIIVGIVLLATAKPATPPQV